MTRLLTLLLASATVTTLAAAPDPNSADARRDARVSGAFGAYLAGRSAAQAGDMGLAATELERAVHDDPSVPELAGQAFLAALLAGRSEAASLAAGLADNPLAQLVLADRDGKAGRWAQAEARFVSLPQQQPLSQVLRPLLIAWAQQGQGQTEAALAGLAPMVAGPRFRGVYALHAALIADLGGRTDEAARLYGVAAAEYGPLNLRLGVILASWRARQGQLPAAQDAIDALASTDGELAIAQAGLAADVSRPAIRNAADGIAEAYLALAATLRQQGADSAPAMLRLALEMRPDLTAARILLADLDESARRPELALTALSEVAADDPLAPLIQLRRAALLAETGQTEAADTLFDTLAREHPSRPEPLAQKADVLRRANRFADAATTYSAAIARVGTPSRNAWPLFYARGISYERAGDWARGEPDLRYALEMAPDQPSVMNYLAYSWAERGEHLDDARHMLERAVSARPDDGAIVDSLGWVLLRLGDADGAVRQLDRAVELQPEDAVINGHLGDALAAAGRTREAEFQWRRALNLKPDEADAKKLNEKLAAAEAALAAPAGPVKP